MTKRVDASKRKNLDWKHSILPVARDMDGRVLTEILEPEFARQRPVTFIPSYESLAVAPAVPGASLDDLPPLPEELP